MIPPDFALGNAQKQMLDLVKKHGGTVTDQCQDAFCVSFPSREQEEAYLEELLTGEIWETPNDPTS